MVLLGSQAPPGPARPHRDAGVAAEGWTGPCVQSLVAFVGIQWARAVVWGRGRRSGLESFKSVLGREEQTVQAPPIGGLGAGRPGTGGGRQAYETLGFSSSSPFPFPAFVEAAVPTNDSSIHWRTFVQ